MKTLSHDELTEFEVRGYLKIPNAFPLSLCEEITETLWKDTSLDRRNPATWTKPVIRLSDYSTQPFRIAANMPLLHQAFNQLIGKHNWVPRGGLGSFPIRFPSESEPGDTGWHVDASFPGDDPSDIFSWRINVRSRGRALLMLFLFSDVDSADAPTRLKEGSHHHIAKILAPFGDEGLSFMELASKLHELPHLPERQATGPAGTVFLCHPFLVHAAQPHHGTHPKFMAQPPLVLKAPFQLKARPEDCYPVERAIIKALDPNS